MTQREKQQQRSKNDGIMMVSKSSIRICIKREDQNDVLDQDRGPDIKEDVEVEEKNEITLHHLPLNPVLKADLDQKVLIVQEVVNRTVHHHRHHHQVLHRVQKQVHLPHPLHLIRLETEKSANQLKNITKKAKKSTKSQIENNR